MTCQCFQVGGPFISEDPDCPAHGTEAQRAERERDAELTRLRAEVEALRADAERYRWLRRQDWFSSPLCVVTEPKQAILPGFLAPSWDHLDGVIDKEMSK